MGEPTAKFTGIKDLTMTAPTIGTTISLHSAGFDPRPEVAKLRRGHEGALVAAVAAIALAVSSVWLPGFSWASGATAGQLVETAAQTADQNARSSGVTHACAGQSWGAETASCLAAIALASGRSQLRLPRPVQMASR